MRNAHVFSLVTIIFSSTLIASSQAPAGGGAPAQPASSAAPTATASSAQPPAPAPPPPSEVLQRALEEVQQTVGAVRLEKWKRGTVREEAGTNIDAIQRDLQGTLPGLLKEADSAPATISKVLPVSRNIDALYNVLVHVVEAARVAAPGDQVGQLQQAMNDLEKARVTLDNHLQDTAVAQEKQVADLKTTVAAQEKSVQAAASAPTPAAPACPAPTPAKKKRPATTKKPASPATSTTTPATPASGTTTTPQ